jgi:hypothetical protein
MQFNRTKLIGLIDAEIQRRTNAAAEATQKEYQQYDASLSAYQERTSESWSAFSRYIEDRIAEGKPVLKEGVPAEIWSRNGYELDFWTKSVPAVTPLRLDDLPALKAMLQSVEDEKISTAELQRLGFKVPSIFSNR